MEVMSRESIQEVRVHALEVTRLTETTCLVDLERPNASKSLYTLCRSCAAAISQASSMFSKDVVSFMFERAQYHGLHLREVKAARVAANAARVPTKCSCSVTSCVRAGSDG